MKNDNRYRPVRRGRISVSLIVVLLVVAAVVALLVPGVREPLFASFGPTPRADTGRYVLHPVTIGPFRIEVTEEGRIDSVRSATLTSNVKGTTTIISIVPEGSMVGLPTVAEFDGVVEFLDSESEATRKINVVGEDGKEAVYDIRFGQWTQLLVNDRQRVRAGDFIAGDVVCELDSSSMVDSELAQQIKVTGARAALETAETNLEIQRTTNEKFIAAARLAEQLAQLDLEKYTAEGGELEQSIDTIQGDIKKNEEELAIAQEEYDRTRDLARKGYTTLYNLEAARLQVTQKRIVQKVKEGELAVLKEWTSKRTMAELEQMAEDTKRDTERALLEARAATAQKEADLEAAKLTLEVEEETLARLQRQIADCKLVAPQAGEVVYVNQSSRRGEQVAIEEGIQVRERQQIIKLPDFSEMRVKTRIHESRIRQIAVGQQVEIIPNARPDLQLNGKIDTLASLPVPGEWPNNNQMEFESTVAITDGPETTSQLKPGMQAELRIIVESRNEPVLQIPVQAVLPIAGRFYTYVMTKEGAERRSLTVGESNDAFTEILDGVAAGEDVILNPRTHFSNEINQLEQELTKEENQGDGKSKKRGGVPPGDGPPNGRSPLRDGARQREREEQPSRGDDTRKDKPTTDRRKRPPQGGTPRS